MNTVMDSKSEHGKPSALEIASHAVVQLENNPLFNSGHGAVFTRDGINELEASVMVSHGFKKRGVGVMGLRHVRNPILLARRMLEHGEQDLSGGTELEPPHSTAGVDAPSAQGHTQIHGEAAEALARQYGCDMVDPSYYFTQQRWDEHVRALEKERQGRTRVATWDADEYLPQGTCGAVAMDERGVVCAATSTGGMTNKLTGRIGDTPVIGAGFWAGEWEEQQPEKLVASAAPGLSFTGPLKGLLADCLPTPFTYVPVSSDRHSGSHGGSDTDKEQGHQTRSIAISGTGNGDSFLRIDAVRTVAAMAQWKPQRGSKALTSVVGPGGELQKSAGDRWGKTGEGEGGMIGIEAVVERDTTGRILRVKSEILMDYNCGGMYRAWINEHGQAVMSIWSNGSADC